ncbi:uncharacterized protein LOC121874605 [Homarus americanus]|uniref:uncharacterized protein LOC121874605 n=1 Tax=Homarus americanus TaxID=6706 RepID=UPI001C4540F9|nr:uncharacterized protein LOC121874605 [Homarus americanus]
MATCDIINVVAAAMGGENIRLREVQLLPVPTLTPRCHVPLSAGFCTSFNVDPFRQVLDLMFSWMIYHSWTQLTILYDQSLNIMANIAIVKSFLVTNKRLGARLSFKEVPAQLATSSASRNQLETALKELLEAWGEEEARHLALIGDKSTIIHVLRMIPNLEDDDSNSDWLIFTSTNDDVSKEYIPANGHRVYFVNRSLHAGLREDVRTALRVGEAVARGVATCWNTTSIKEIVETPVTIYMKPPNYSAMLIPPVEVPGPSQTRLVPLYTWSPSSSSTSSPHLFSGRFKALPSYDQYQLHGAHLYVATLRSAPFIKPVEAPVDEHAWEGSNRTQKPPSPQLPHVTCPQPLAFVGFLKDMLDVLSIQMNFTYTLYEVCDGSYGSLVDGRWTGVVGEVMYGYAHIGLSNLGANYARSHAVSFPRVSTSYGGAGTILKRPRNIQ